MPRSVSNDKTHHQQMLNWRFWVVKDLHSDNHSCSTIKSVPDSLVWALSLGHFALSVIWGRAWFCNKFNFLSTLHPRLPSPALLHFHLLVCFNDSVQQISQVCSVEGKLVAKQHSPTAPVSPAQVARRSHSFHFRPVDPFSLVRPTTTLVITYDTRHVGDFFS